MVQVRALLSKSLRLRVQSANAIVRIIELCVSYLRNFLQLIHTPAFQPYVWFCRTISAPLQSTFLILTYLQDHRETAAEVQALYMVHEVLDFFVEESDNDSSIDTRNGKDGNHKNRSIQEDPSWKTLQTLLRKVESLSRNHRNYQLPHDAGHLSSNPSIAVFCQPSPPHASLSPNVSLASESPMLFTPAFQPRSGSTYVDHEVGSIADSSDPDTWSFSLLQTPDSLKPRPPTHRSDHDRKWSSRVSNASGHESDSSRSVSGQPGTISPFQILNDSRKESRGMERSPQINRGGETHKYGQSRSPWDGLESIGRSTAPSYAGQSSSDVSINSNLGAMTEHPTEDLDLLVDEALWMNS